MDLTYTQLVFSLYLELVSAVSNDDRNADDQTYKETKENFAAKELYLTV